MRKIVIGVHAGVVGTESWEFYEVSEHLTAEQLDALAWECAKNHAESYGIYPRGEYDFEDDECDEDIDESYSDNIEGWWEDYDSDKHDGHTIGGVVHWDVL